MIKAIRNIGGVPMQSESHGFLTVVSLVIVLSTIGAALALRQGDRLVNDQR